MKNVQIAWKKVYENHVQIAWKKVLCMMVHCFGIQYQEKLGKVHPLIIFKKKIATSNDIWKDKSALKYMHVNREIPVLLKRFNTVGPLSFEQFSEHRALF